MALTPPPRPASGCSPTSSATSSSSARVPVDGTPAAGGIRLSDPSDRFERAAEENADQIVSRIAEPSASTGGSEPVQRQAEGGEEEEEEPVQTLQRQAEGGEEEEEEPGPV